MPRLVENSAADEPQVALTVPALEAAVRFADPAAILVPPRILRRVIKQDTDLGGIGLRVPHRKCYVIPRDRLLAIVDAEELDAGPAAELADLVILIARPSGEILSDMDPELALQKYWRLLFHTRVHVALARAIDRGRLNEAEVANRIRELGRAEFEEIRSVLRQEDYLLPPKTDLTVYVEFVAVYLELRQFVPSFLRCYFPSLEDYHVVDALVERDVDAQALLKATRLPGCGEPIWPGDGLPEAVALETQSDAGSRPATKLSRRKAAERAARLLAKADHASLVGNLVRAAILRSRAARLAAPHPEGLLVNRSAIKTAAEIRAEACGELTRLARRLQAALNFTSGEADEWAKSLHGLLDQSARGFWTAEARMLYDLQKVCIDHERGIYTLDFWSWVRSLGRQPIKRFLPGQRDVMITKHLRNAAQRLPSTKLSHRARGQLSALLQSASHRAETALRARFKPAIDRSLDQVKLRPRNPPERVARKKIVDEILDRIVERGFVSMSDLRDSLSRNNLKLPDLTSARQFFSGDQLLLADKQLAASLDGVYHAGEIYLRLPQRLSSLAFGTPPGRFLTRYAILPFGGAYVALEGLQYLIDEVIGLFTSPKLVHLVSPWSVATLGAIVLGLLHHARFRSWCTEAALFAGRCLRHLFVSWPAWLLAQSVVQRIVKSWQFRLLKQLLIKPLIMTAIVVLFLRLVLGFQHTNATFGVLFLLVNFALNSRIGRNVDEFVTDWMVLTWHRVRIHVFAAIFRMIMDVFNRILETVERLLYTVDEWLRFRAGERPSATVAKAVLGSVWFFVNYFIRFCVVLLIEPQVNPIKHFPVVTVSHKILFLQIPTLERALTGPLGKAWARAVAPTVIFMIPGVFGFLVWELKENWRLYAANRPPNLVPIPIGQHGETVLQFLKPGFRSGTLPKLYAKLRRASRKAYWTQNWKACGKHLDSLHHVSQSLRRFVDRELLELLHESRGWADRSIATGEIHLGCNRILIELYCPALAEDSLWLAFEDQNGWLVAAVHRCGWVDSLSATRRRALASALAGFYKMAGVDVVREQIEERLASGSPGYEITDHALVVWPSGQDGPRAYPLRDWTPDERAAIPATVAGQSDSRDPAPWVFAATPISWRRWVVTWELDQLGGSSRYPIIEDLHLLPHDQESTVLDPRRTAS